MKTDRSRRLTPIFLVVALGLAAAAVLGVESLGLFLVVADPLRPSDAIFVLDGQTPERELEASALYHRKLAPRIVLTRTRDATNDLALRLAGEAGAQERSARVLGHLRVPPAAIVRLGTPADNTEEELRIDFDWARERGFRRVILVTSPYHTRRVRLIWGTRWETTVHAIVHPTPYEPFDPLRWWRSRRSIEATLHELLGIAHFAIGSPLPTFDAASH